MVRDRWALWHRAAVASARAAAEMRCTDVGGAVADGQAVGILEVRMIACLHHLHLRHPSGLQQRAHRRWNWPAESLATEASVEERQGHVSKVGYR